MAFTMRAFNFFLLLLLFYQFELVRWENTKKKGINSSIRYLFSSLNAFWMEKQRVLWILFQFYFSFQFCGCSCDHDAIIFFSTRNHYVSYSCFLIYKRFDWISTKASRLHFMPMEHISIRNKNCCWFLMSQQHYFAFYCDICSVVIKRSCFFFLDFYFST